MKKFLLMYGRFSNEFIFADFDTTKERDQFNEDVIVDKTEYSYSEKVQYSKLSKKLKEICDRQLNN